MAYADEYKSAQEVLAANGGDGAAENARQEALIAAAEDAGVTRSEYIGYETAFAEYESRPDIEPLAERRARDSGTVDEQQFRREGTGSAAVFTSPGDGNVGGLIASVDREAGVDGELGTEDDVVTENPVDTPGA